MALERRAAAVEPEAGASAVLVGVSLARVTLAASVGRVAGWAPARGLVVRLSKATTPQYA